MAKRFKLATTLNVAGLILAFAFFYLLMTQILYQWTYNHGVNDYEQLYRLETDFVYRGFSDNVCRPFADALDSLVESYSLVQNIRIGEPSWYYRQFKRNEKVFNFLCTNGNNTVVSTLTKRRLDGSIEWTDSVQTGYIIPASIAKDYFGTIHAAGDTMLIMGKDLKGNDSIIKRPVRGVYEDFPKNSELWNCVYSNMGSINKQPPLNALYKCYIKLKSEPTDLEAFTDSIKEAIVKYVIAITADPDSTNESIQNVKQMHCKLTPLKSSYFEHNSFTLEDTGYKVTLYILILACLLVILTATINFLNFTLAESPLRIRSLNTRLVLGAERRHLRLGFVIECVIIAVVTCLLGLAVCWSLTPAAQNSSLIVGSVAINDHWLLALFMVGLAVIVGFAAGYYPAVFATSFSPATALKGSFGITPQGKRLRNILITFQMFVTLLSVTYTGILFLQRHYIRTIACGYDKSQMLFYSLPESSDSIQTSSFCQALSELPEIEDISFSSLSLGSTDGHSVVNASYHGHRFSYCFLWTDYHFLKTMGINIVDGRNFTAQDSAIVIVNEAAQRQWEWLKLGMKISTSIDNSNDSATVIGVCENVRYGTTRFSSDEPFLFILDNAYPGNEMNVRIAPGASRDDVRRQISNLAKTYFDGNAGEVYNYDKNIEQAYKNEFRYISQIFIISVICLIITLIGVFCLTMFETEYRRKEIGIRKVAGATTNEIIKMLCWQYLPLILISFAIAAPLAYYFGWLTLQNFVNHTTNYWWIPFLSLLLVGGVIIMTVIMQSWRTARENPSNSIRIE